MEKFKDILDTIELFFRCLQFKSKPSNCQNKFFAFFRVCKINLSACLYSICLEKFVKDVAFGAFASLTNFSKQIPCNQAEMAIYVRCTFLITFISVLSVHVWRLSSVQFHMVWSPAFVQCSSLLGRSVPL